MGGPLGDPGFCFFHSTVRPTLNIFFKTLLILQKDTKVGSRNFGYQIWFCTRLITWTCVDLSSVRSSGIHLSAILQEMPQPSVTEIILKITYINFCSHLPGANVLIHFKLISHGPNVCEDSRMMSVNVACLALTHKTEMHGEPVFGIAWCCQPHRMGHWQHINSLRPSDATWQHESGSTLAQVMACCLMAPSHYLNQCWLITKGVLWHSPESNFTGNAQDITLKNEFENYNFKIINPFPRGQRVNLKMHLMISRTGILSISGEYHKISLIICQYIGKAC